ncbi:ABC transporter permease [Sphingobacterium faecium]|uniref:ABC transporter permease n=1 Tax=Sphingobacterium faecium TaxID=34087 RepID=UPI00320809EC
MMIYAKMKGFLKRDYLIESRYKLNFMLNFVNSIFPVVSFFFVSKLINGSDAGSLTRYGGDYFSFALIGVAFTRFFQLAVDTFSGSIKRAQMAGCLEAILSSQTDSKTVVLFSSIYSFLTAGIQLIFMFLIGTFFLGFDFSHTNVLSLVVSLVISLFAFVSLGIFSAAGTVIYKQGEPIGWVFGAISALIGGAMFPVSIMPGWLQFCSKIFPTTYALDTIRLSVLQGYSIHMMGKELLILLLMSVILFPLSLRTFNWAVEKGKKDGTLMSY